MEHKRKTKRKSPLQKMKLVSKKRHPDEKEDIALIRKMVKKPDLKRYR